MSQKWRRYGPSYTSIQRFFRNVVIVLLIALGAIIFFVIVLLIAFNFAAFVQILFYLFWVAVALTALGILYLIVRIITAISHRLSAASLAKTKVKLERQRVQQSQVQVLSQRSKVARENYTFYQQQESGFTDERRPRTQVVREEPGGFDEPAQRRATRDFRQESPYRTRVLAQQGHIPQISPRPEFKPGALALEESELEVMGMPKKGQVFAYAAYTRYLKPGELIIGIRKDGSPRVGSWQDFKITLVLGSSSSGKSTTVLEKCMCVVDGGGLLIICDPGGFKPDSLTKRIGPLQGALMPGTGLALEHEEIMQNVGQFRDELERRRRGADMTTPILLIIDELNGLLMDKEIKKELTELIEKFAQQARGYHMYMILCAQRASGLAAIRNSVISFICHKCPEMEAAKILPARYAKLAPQLGVGQTFVCDADGAIEALQQTLITKQDIAQRASRRLATMPIPRRTEPVVPSRIYGAAPSQPPKRVLQKTLLVQGAPSSVPLPPAPSLSVPQRSSGASAMQDRKDNPAWLDTVLVSDPDRQSGITPPVTEELAPRSPTSLPSTVPISQNALDLLVERRTKKKK